MLSVVRTLSWRGAGSVESRISSPRSIDFERRESGDKSIKCAIGNGMKESEEREGEREGGPHPDP